MKTGNRKLNNFCSKIRLLMLIFIQMLLIIQFSSVFVMGEPGFKKETGEMLQKARAAHLKHEFNQSEALYNDVFSLRVKNNGSDSPEAGEAISGLADLYYDQGKYEQARELYSRSLDINEKYFGPESAATAKGLNGLATACLALGEYSAALTFYQHSFVIYKGLYGEQSPQAAKCLSNLGEVYKLLGDLQRAEEFLEKSLQMAEDVYSKSHPERVVILNNLGNVSREAGEYLRAKHFYERALHLQDQLNSPDDLDKAAVLNNLAGLCYYTGDHQQAKRLYERALAIDEKIRGADHPDVAVRLNNLAEIYYDAGHYTRARRLYERALVVAQERGFLELLWRTQFNLACLFEKKDNIGAAVFWGKKAVNTIQNMRSGIKDIDSDLQQTFVKNKGQVYRFLADLLIDQGRLGEAQQVLDMQKEEEYFDFIKRDAKKNSRISYTRKESLLEERYDKINKKIAAIGRGMAALEKRRNRGLTAEEEKRYLRLKKDLKAARKAFVKYFSVIPEELGDSAIQRYADIRKKRVEKPGKLQELIRELGHGAVAVHYLVSDDKLRIILTTGDVQLVRDSAVTPEDLNRKIMNFRKILQRPRLSPFSTANALYDIVLKPIEQDLEQAGAKMLMLCLDGPLRYLPVAALYDGERYVTEKYRIAVYTPAAGLSAQKMIRKSWEVAGFGLSRAINGLEPLTGVESELEGIILKDKNDPDGVVPGVIYMNEAFNDQSIGSVLKQKYPVIHIASHFELNPGTAEDSYLVLGDGTALTLSQIREGHYDFSCLEMLSLSACNTAIGLPNANGSEVESFGVLAQNRGAGSVLATLWPVSDESTGAFMKKLYQLHEQKKGESKADALRGAQLLFIHGAEKNTGSGSRSRLAVLSFEDKKRLKEDVTFTPDPKAPYAHPYYWAPFVLMGNWL